MQALIRIDNFKNMDDFEILSEEETAVSEELGKSLFIYLLKVR